MNTCEYRTLRGLTVREAPQDSGFIGVLAGRAAVFNSDSMIFEGWGKPWIERIAPGAFTRSLQENPDVRALWSHRSDSPLARAPKTLALRESDEGLEIEISLIDTQRNRDVLADVRSGNVDAMSFGFAARKVEWDESDKLKDTRTLLDVDLFEVSPVVWPAYPATSISARSLVARSAGPDLDAELRATSEERAAFFAARQPAPAIRAHFFPGLRIVAPVASQ